MKISEVTQSQQFKRWFGDWQNDPANASKVVNADGTPKVVYHGTDGEFTVFDRSKGKKKVHLNVFGDGNYFTALETGAARYGKNVMGVYLDIKNPYISNPAYNTVADQMASDFSLDRTTYTGKDVSSMLKARGYDGVLRLDENGGVVIANAFDQNQIKSATDNVGTFDKSNPDIRFSSRAQQDSEYMELAKDPEKNKLELLEMVDAAAAAAGFEYRRNTNRKHKPSNDVDWQMFVRGIDHDQSNYGKYTFLATDKGAIQAEDIMPKLRQLAEEFYGEQISDEEINPPDIVISAGIWDDVEFVQYMWDNFFEEIFYSTGEMPAIVTEDGMIVYGDDFKRVKSGDAVEYDDNGDVIPLSQRFNVEKDDIRYSLRNTTDGRTAAVVDEDILSGIDLTQWNAETKKKVQTAARDALKKFSDGIVVDGITRSVNRISRKEYTGSKYSEKISKTMPQMYSDKMRAASVAGDMVVASTDWARDGKLVHPRADNFVDFDHGNVLIEVGENQYSAEVVVGITSAGNAVFYDVVDIQPAQFTTKRNPPVKPGVLHMRA